MFAGTRESGRSAPPGQTHGEVRVAGMLRAAVHRGPGPVVRETCDGTREAVDDGGEE